MATDNIIKEMFQAARERYRSNKPEGRQGNEEVLMAISWLGGEIQETRKQREAVLEALREFGENQNRLLKTLCEDRKARRLSPTAAGTGVAALLVAAGAALKFLGYV